MKKINVFLILLAASALLSSCLKDPNITDDLLYGDEGIGKGKLIQFVSEGVGANFIDNASERKDVDLIGIKLSNDNPATEDITIELAFDQEYLDEYNEEHETDYEIPPTNMFTLVNGMKAIIPKGERIGYFKINVLPSEFLGGAYAFPVKVVSVSPQITIASTSRESIMTFGTKNAYDGIYSILSGTVQRYTNPTTPTVGDALNGSLTDNDDMILTTKGANVVEIENLQWATGGGVAGIDNLQIVVDPATNLVTMRALGNPTLVNVPGRENKYDPTAKTFTLNFHWNPTANKREVLDLKIKYANAR